MAGKTLAEYEKDRLRQSERTIDNLKRLYAVLFSLSFAIVAQGTVVKILLATDAGDFSIKSILLNTEMTVSFLITAGLFYYQGDRFLDIMFAREPLGEITRFHFGLNYAINVCQMIPIYLMAHGLSYDNTIKVGFTWYFVAYTSLIILGLTLLFIKRIAQMIRPRKEPRPVAALGAFWALMNSLMLFAIISLWALYREWGIDCPTNGASTASFTFLLVFGALVLSRDLIDFSTAWRVVYPTPRNTKFGKILVHFYSKSAQTEAWRIAFFVFALIIFMVLYFDMWNILQLRDVCKV